MNQNDHSMCNSITIIHVDRHTADHVIPIVTAFDRRVNQFITQARKLYVPCILKHGDQRKPSKVKNPLKNRTAARMIRCILEIVWRKLKFFIAPLEPLCRYTISFCIYNKLKNILFYHVIYRLIKIGLELIFDRIS